MLLFWEKKAKPVAVKADADMVNEILSNLVDNALKHSAATQVRIVLDGASVRVQDNGMGVSEEQLPQIFERFHRGDNAKASGYGLGLSITLKNMPTALVRNLTQVAAPVCRYCCGFGRFTHKCP